VLVNLQKRYVVRRALLEPFVDEVKRRLRLAGREFNICFVDDDGIRRLNAAYRGKDEPTDVLSFAWNDATGGAASSRRAPSPRRAWGERCSFLGELVISVETARRNAGAEGHSTLNENRWLILHGVLHLLGYDHARDRGEMTNLELALREQMGVASGRAGRKQVKGGSAKGRSPNRSRRF